MPITNKSFERDAVKQNQTLESIKEAPEVMERISPRGFTEVRMDFALNLRTESNDIYQNLLSSRGEQINLRMLLDEKFKYVGTNYSSFTALLKAEFINEPRIIRVLGIEGARKDGILEFISQGTNGYTNLKKKPKILSRLIHLGMTVETLDADLLEIKELNDLHDQYTYKMGECQKLLEERDKKYNELLQFMKQLKIVLFLVFPEGERQILERHGIFVRNQPKVKKPDEEPAEPPIPVNPPDDTLVTNPTDSTEPADTSKPTEDSNTSEPENNPG